MMEGNEKRQGMVGGEKEEKVEKKTEEREEVGKEKGAMFCPRSRRGEATKQASGPDQSSKNFVFRGEKIEEKKTEGEEKEEKDPRPIFKGLGTSSPEEVFSSLPTPAYVLDEEMLLHNARLLGEVSQRTGARILLAQKAFSCFNLYDLLSPYAAGTEASGLFEARLGFEKMPGKEVHVFCGAYKEEEMDELLLYADHVVVNTPGQLKRFGPRIKAAGKSLGLRINPEFSTQEGHAIYDPCAPGSRLGTTRALWDREMGEEEISLLDGLHFHTLCEQGAEELEVTLEAVFARFGDILPKMKWINFGGGHHITKEGYDLQILEKCIRKAQDIGLMVYLEPGEAWALNAGYLVTRVLDTFQNGDTNLAIVDASAACHMPDVLEMPYVPPLYGREEWGEEKEREEERKEEGKKEEREKEEEKQQEVKRKEKTEKEEKKIEAKKEKKQEEREEIEKEREEKKIPICLGGPTCLAGDVIGTYAFRKLPELGDLLLFGDMAIYTMCKNNTFNGMPLPPIYLFKKDGELKELVSFGYEDFVGRLGR